MLDYWLNQKFLSKYILLYYVCVWIGLWMSGVPCPFVHCTLLSKLFFPTLCENSSVDVAISTAEILGKIKDLTSTVNYFSSLSTTTTTKMIMMAHYFIIIALLYTIIIVHDQTYKKTLTYIRTLILLHIHNII